MKLKSTLGLYFHVNFFFHKVSLKSQTSSAPVLPKSLLPSCEGFTHSVSDFSRN